MLVFHECGKPSLKWNMLRNQINESKFEKKIPTVFLIPYQAIYTLWTWLINHLLADGKNSRATDVSIVALSAGIKFRIT